MTSPLQSVMAAGVALLVLGAPARAEDATPVQAASLEAQIKAWIAAAAPGVTAGPGRVQATPSGDHLDVSVPMQLHGAARGNIQVTGTARPHDGKWSIAGIRTAVPLVLTLDVPIPRAEGQKGPPRTAPLVYTVNAQAQDTQVEFDPSFASPSSSSSSLKGLTILAEGAGTSQASTIEEARSTASLVPSGPDRVDFATDGTMSGYTLVNKGGAELPAFSATLATIRVAASATGVSRDRAAKLFQSLSAIGHLAHAAPDAPPNLPKPMLANLIAALQDFASEVKLAETFEGIKVEAGGMAFALDQVVFGSGGTSEAGMLRTTMELGYSGLKMPDMGLGGMEALIPAAVSLRPSLSGVAVADLARILTTLNDKKDPSPADMAALFSHGGVVTGLDTLAVTVAGASFTGQGKLTMTSPQQMTGTAQLVAENYDAMVQTMSGFPMAAQAMPVLIFLKGIGRTDGGKLVWDVTYRDGKALVNNIDITAMAGGPPAATTVPVPTNPAPGGALKSPPRQNPNRNR